MGKGESLIVVGNGMVGQRFVDEVLARDDTDRWAITVIGEEPRPAYDRVALSSWFETGDTDDLTLADPDALRAAGVTLRYGSRVENIDRKAKTVTLDDRSVLAFDHLVLATGSSPFVPPIDGRDAPGCFVYRTIDDLEAIADWAGHSRSGVVIGGGLLGLEAANALRNLSLETHVVEMAPRLMPQQLDAAASDMLRQWVHDLQITTHLDFQTAAIESTDRVVGLRHADGSVLPTDLVVFSAGIRPRDELARAAGLGCGERGGVTIDDRCRTSDAAISAIGEVACHNGRVYGLVAPGYAMARALAEQLCGDDDARFAGTDLSTKLKLLGVGVASFGDTNDGDDDRVEYRDPTSGIHRRVSIRDGVVTAGVLVGDTSGYDELLAMSRGQMETAGLASLIVPRDLAAAPSGPLPDSALLCSCNNVSIGDAKVAVRQGCDTIAALKSETTAGTGCGGCVPAMNTLLNVELAAMGKDVNTGLCEHFDHSRQDLFDLIRFHRHKTWSEVVSAHGRGRGCDVCRPVVASILASLANGYVLDGDQATLQDTNDHALANMQRNGTYSVVPRVPGGEITPDQLIALGEIAKDYELYTKITGAQRVDLFGARLGELPAIWERVRAAGMESGHAYGKALRTVKSCVGDTWCRYGVQDSVSMAIEIELRYRGLRAPHKLKSAVSGCTRECAEAQSKDFGIIATESGWNLYVAGNGGRQPRHADLLETDLDDEQLIRLIDRFLMFYIRTADRLERTSVWFEKLEGGMDHLRRVIVDDALGICAELEADMQRHVDTYSCEWSDTLDNPERLTHFVEFVNAPDQHSAPVWISSRGQRIPAATGEGR
ncbi:MAG: nitrite reductase large subunit NirB [Actinomycetota bacterium]